MGEKEIYVLPIPITDGFVEIRWFPVHLSQEDAERIATVVLAHAENNPNEQEKGDG